jgi:hypothetical protein
MGKFKIKISILLLLAIVIILVSLLIIQNNKFKEVVGWYDLLILSNIENEMSEVIYFGEKGEMSQEVFREKREHLKYMANMFGASYNKGLLPDKIYRIITSVDEISTMNEFEEYKLLQKKLETLFKEKGVDNAVKIYNYFRDEETRQQFIKEISISN